MLHRARIIVFTALAVFSTLWPSESPADPKPKRVVREYSLSTRGFVPANLQFRLRSAHQLARERLEGDDRCRTLFAPLDADGLDILEGSTYGIAQPGPELSICSQRSAAAFTTVGGHQVRLCPREFSRLTVYRAAMILIHESLHRAGMTEWPGDPTGLRSVEINNLIRDRCSL